MFKRLIIGLFALSLAAIWLSEANARDVRKRRSVGVTVYSDLSSPNEQDLPFVTGVFGLPGDCKVRGDLYCARTDTEADILECDKATGDSAARVWVIDRDSIGKGTPYRDSSETEFEFSKIDVNWYGKGLGQREQLPFFENYVIAAAGDPNASIIYLTIGKKRGKKLDPGFHAIKEIPPTWPIPSPENEALQQYVGTWDDESYQFITAEGFGWGTPPQKYLKPVPVEPIVDPTNLVGETICGVVHHNQIRGNQLKGNYLGLVAFKVLEFDDPWLKVEVQDADDVCQLPKYIEASTVTVEEGGQECLVVDGVAEMTEPALVFAPAPSNGIVLEGEGTFIAQLGSLSDCSGPYCKGTVEVVLDQAIGQSLCEDFFEDYPGVTFVDFIPINRGEGDYHDKAFIGTLEFPVGDGTSYEKVICSAGAEGGSLFACELFEEPVPDCGPEPDPECEGETCAGGFPTPCNQPQPEGGCSVPVCISTPEVQGFCVEGATPCSGLVGCYSSADCSPGEACAVLTCCHETGYPSTDPAQGVCIPESAFCPEPDGSEEGAEYRAKSYTSAEGGATIGGCK